MQLRATRPGHVKGTTALAFGLAALALALAGCATAPGKSWDRSDPLAVADHWRQALARQNYGRALRLVSDRFAGAPWPNKAALADYLEVAQERGYFANAEVVGERPDVSERQGTARIYPVSIRADLGLAVFALVVEQKKFRWEIVSIEMELY